MSTPRELLFYTKPDCPLCDDGLARVVPVARRHGLEVKKVNIEDDAELFYRHRFRIPVVEYDGHELGWGRLDEKAIEKKLARLM